MTREQIIESVNGNQINGRAANRFFELRGYSNRRPHQSNVGNCMLWSALKNAVEESSDVQLKQAVAELA